MSTIRPSTDSDIPAITAIYQHHVLHGTGTFEIDPPSEADMAGRRADVLARGLPWLVAEQDGQVLGFAYANWFKPRPAYRFSAEDSIYVADSALGMGLGTPAQKTQHDRHKPPARHGKNPPRAARARALPRSSSSRVSISFLFQLLSIPRLMRQLALS